MSYPYLPPLEKWERRENGDLVYVEENSRLQFPDDRAAVSMDAADSSPVNRGRREFVIAKVTSEEYHLMVESEDKQEYMDGVYPVEGGADRAHAAFNHWAKCQRLNEIFGDAEYEIGNLVGLPTEWFLMKDRLLALA